MSCRRTLATIAAIAAIAILPLLGWAPPAQAALRAATGASVAKGQVVVVAANVSRPVAIAAAPDGNLWFTGGGNNSIGRVTPAGALTFFRSDQIHDPGAIVAGADGNLWFVNDTKLGGTGTIGRISTAGAIDTFYGARQARSIAAGPDGRLWFANADATIGAMTTDGIVSTYGRYGDAFPQVRDLVAGPDGNVWFTRFDNAIGRITPDGVLLPAFTDPALAYPEAIAAGPDGNVWFTNSTAASVGRITPAGGVTTFPITGSVANDITTGADGNLWFDRREGVVDQNQVGRITPLGVATYVTTPVRPAGLTAGPDGNLWFTSTLDNRVGRITPAGATATFANSAVRGPQRITTGPDGNLWYTNQGGSSIGRITPSGGATTFTGPGVLAPFDITAGPDGNLWFTNLASIGRITPAGVITRFAGPEIVSPHEITTGPDGNLWFTDPSANRIGRITPSGVVDTFGANVVSHPLGITAHTDGNLWFTNWSSNTIGRITPAGTVTTFPVSYGKHPNAIVSAPDGNVYFANEDGFTIEGMSTTGSSGMAYGNGNRADTADLTIGPDGNIWFTNRLTSSIETIQVSTFTLPFVVPINRPVPLAGENDLHGLSGLTMGPDGNLWFLHRDVDEISYTGMTPVALPSAPTGFAGTSGNGQVTLRWAAPASPGGAPVTSYKITVQPMFDRPVARVVPAGVTQLDFAGLTNDLKYTFSIQAVNAAGAGAIETTPAIIPTWFTDVAGSPFREDISWAYLAGIVTGYPDGTFHPTAAMTRQSLAALLYRAKVGPDDPSPCATAPFPDVPVDAPFCPEIAWLAASGVTAGYPDGGFHPTATVTRQAMAAFLYRLAGAPVGAHPMCDHDWFTDVSMDAAFCGEIAWLAVNGVAYGDSDTGRFRPAAPLSRQAAVAFLHRANGLLHP